MLEELQFEINHLMFLYFTSIGIIQRDSYSNNLNETITQLIAEIKDCRLRINSILEEKKDEKISVEYEKIVEEGKIFVNQGFIFIDKIIEKL